MRELQHEEVKEVGGGYSEFIPGILPYPIYPIPNPEDERYPQFTKQD